MNEIEEHESTDLRVIGIRGHEMEVDLGDHRVKVGEAIRVGDILARVVGIPGQRKAVAQIFGTSSISLGDRVELLGRPALMERLQGAHEVRELNWVVDDGVVWSPTPPPFMSIDASREKVASGSAVLDRAYPLMRGGVHMVLDSDPQGGVFRALAERLSAGHVITANLSFPSQCSIEGVDDFEKWMAIRAGVAQVCGIGGESTFLFEVPVSTTQRREHVFGEEAPNLSSALNQITEPLVSTKTSRKTVLIRVPIWGTDASSYVETLNIGDVDTCWFVSEDGINLRKSTSRHGDPSEILSILERAERAESKRSLLGEEELEGHEIRDIAEASQLVVSMTHLLDVASPEH